LHLLEHRQKGKVSLKKSFVVPIFFKEVLVLRMADKGEMAMEDE
jgi:hypothetical protein